MPLFKRDSNKAGKKFRDSKSEINQIPAADVFSTSSMHTSVVGSVADLPQPHVTPVPSETVLSQPATVEISASEHSPEVTRESLLQAPTSVSTIVREIADNDHESTSFYQPATTAILMTGTTPAIAAEPAAQAPTSAVSGTSAVSLAQVPIAASTIPLPAAGKAMGGSMSVAMQAKATPSAEKGKDMKMEAADSYMYGPKSDMPEKKPSSSLSETQPRVNRAQALRQERNMNRIHEEKLMREQILKERVMRSHSDTSSSGGTSDTDDVSDDGEPILARQIPRSLYHKPRIAVRDTLSSKFRYLFNRKPAGVNVYFKQADDPKKKPPFVLASVNHCF